MDDLTTEFERHRDLMYAVAYRMLGIAADADDVVQDAWLRWSSADRSGVDEPRAYLVRIATNLAINRLTSARARREAYVGPWLPEPVRTGPDVAESAELADSVSFAMLVVLERLTPVERAVFLLREVFGFSHAEIAEVTGRSEAGVRQLAHRARERVREGRPKYSADRAEQRRVTAEFIDACRGGDVDKLMEVLAPDVTMWSDGGGVRRAARNPIRGVEKVVRLATALVSMVWWEGAEPYEFADINGALGVILHEAPGDGGVVLLPEIADGRITALNVVVNPEKLRALHRGDVLNY
ncbi:MAG TPA: RNA polymerase sigma factor SigJ [Streptosporangiaceae bacterium]|jgi:RNA polymerase sigma-70 factor (ECF subfamily)